MFSTTIKRITLHTRSKYGLSLLISFNDNRYSSIPIKHKVEASNQATMGELPYNKFKFLLE